MKIAFKNFGCRANSLESDALFLEARRRGHEVVGETQLADAYIINSCTVTAAADRDARWEATRFKRKNPLAQVGVIGCYAQVGKEELLALPEIDFVVGTANKFSILDLLETSDGTRDHVAPATGFLPIDFPGSRHARANIKIQDGCNFNCSFCIIPQARGRSRSLPIETILKQIDTAWAQGFEEIVLTGIHIAHYGWDLNTDLMALLRAIFAKRVGPRVRISTLDPFEIPDELISWLGVEKRLCPHFHIAIQSGSDKILQGMRRIYKAAEFVEVNRKIEAQYPDTFIGVDVIVGFPGETEEEFQETVRLLASSFWTKLHVFPFSVRKGTRAEELPGKVSPAEITKRSEVLRRMSDERMQKFLQKQIGKTVQPILEKTSRKHPGAWIGHSENYLPILTMATGETRQKIAASITRVEGEWLWATAL